MECPLILEIVKEIGLTIDAAIEQASLPSQAPDLRLIAFRC
jgi:hypothetical protein